MKAIVWQWRLRADLLIHSCLPTRVHYHKSLFCLKASGFCFTTNNWLSLELLMDTLLLSCVLDIWCFGSEGSSPSFRVPKYSTKNTHGSSQASEIPIPRALMPCFCIWQYQAPTLCTYICVGKHTWSKNSNLKEFCHSYINIILITILQVYVHIFSIVTL